MNVPVTDPIADMLTRMRNAVHAKHPTVLIPSSKVKIAIAQILKDEGFIRDFEVLQDCISGTLKVYLKYVNKEPVMTGLKRVSKPGLRVYVKRDAIPRVMGGIGVCLVSTPMGMMTGRKAWRENVGGEIVAFVW